MKFSLEVTCRWIKPKRMLCYLKLNHLLARSSWMLNNIYSDRFIPHTYIILSSTNFLIRIYLERLRCLLLIQDKSHTFLLEKIAYSMIFKNSCIIIVREDCFILSKLKSNYKCKDKRKLLIINWNNLKILLLDLL